MAMENSGMLAMMAESENQPARLRGNGDYGKPGESILTPEPWP